MPRFTDIIPLAVTHPDEPIFAAEDRLITVNSSPWDTDSFDPVYTTVYWRTFHKDDWRKCTMGFEVPMFLATGENYAFLDLEPSDSIRFWL